MSSYTEALAQSMQRTKEKVIREVMRDLRMPMFAERRSKNLNNYYHGVLNGIREQTETLR